MTNNNTPINSTIATTPVGLDDAAELLSTAKNITTEVFEDFTIYTGQDESGRCIAVIMGHVSGSAAVISRQSAPVLAFALAA